MSVLKGWLSISVIVYVSSLVTGQKIPPSPCPQVFQYLQQPKGDIYGGINIPYDGSSALNLGINASMKGFYANDGSTSLSIKMITSGEDLLYQRTQTLTYSVSFPYQHTIPKITKIQLNNKVYCTGPPEELIPGTPGVSSLWAGHRFFFQKPPGNNDLGPPPPPEPSFEDFDPYEEPPPPPPPSQQEVAFRPPPPSQPSVPPPAPQPSVPSRNQYQECGVSKNQIVPLILGGAEVSEGTFPWLAAMFVSKGTGYEYKCTSNLVSEKHVLTAARCINYYKIQTVQTEQILFVFGKMNLKNWAASNPITRGASQIQTHPDFDQDSGHGDVSIITLDRLLQFSKSIAPICLWSGKNDFKDIVGQTGTVAGWGADEVAQKAGQYSVSIAKSIEMPIVSDDDCLNSNLSYYSLTSDNTFCAGKRDGSGTCVGDNGAGFMLNKKGVYYLRGLASLTLNDNKGKCDLSFFMIFCDVAKVEDWIKENMKD